jgi:predicted  nucleic acid-binding Zn-ribbon protein
MKLQDPLKKNKKKKTNKINYNFTNIANRFKKEIFFVTIQDLQTKINQLKLEISGLKTVFKVSSENIFQEIIAIKTENELSPKIEEEITKEFENIEEPDKLLSHENIETISNTYLFINLIDKIIFQKKNMLK